MKIYWLTKVDKHMLHKTSRIECAESLRKRGNKVILVTGEPNKSLISYNEHQLSLPIFKNIFLSRFSFNLSILINLPHISRKNSPDIIMLDAGNVYLPFLIPIKLMGKKIIVDIRTLPLDNKKTLHSILFDISLKLSKYLSSGLTTITPELKEVLIKKYGLQKKNIGVWTSGVSLNRFNPDKIKNNSNLQQVFNNVNDFFVMYHGAYSPTRGIENLVESIAEIDISIRENIKLIIIGLRDGKQKEIRKHCERLNIEKNVILLPSVDYDLIPSYIQKADIGIIPLPPKNKWWKVSAPLKTMEYLAMAKPIIATNIPFHKRIFKKGSCGILLSTNDKDVLAKSIESMYANKEKLKEMGNNGRKTIEQFYSWDKSALDLENSLHRIISIYES